MTCGRTLISTDVVVSIRSLSNQKNLIERQLFFTKREDKMIGSKTFIILRRLIYSQNRLLIWIFLIVESLIYFCFCFFMAYKFHYENYYGWCVHNSRKI